VNIEHLARVVMTTEAEGGNGRNQGLLDRITHGKLLPSVG